MNPIALFMYGMLAVSFTLVAIMLWLTFSKRRSPDPQPAPVTCPSKGCGRVVTLADMRCFNCKEVGHIMRVFPRMGQVTVGFPSYKCANCKLGGGTNLHCPSCKTFLTQLFDADVMRG